MTDQPSTETSHLLERLATTFPDRPAPLPEIVAAAHAGQRRRARRTTALVAAVVVLAAGGGAALRSVLPDDQRSDGRVADARPTAVCNKEDPVPPRERVPPGPDYPTNAAGETYGSAIDNSPRPDLLAAIGDCGRTGYIRPGELDPPPWVPGAGGPMSTPVYESDGVTQIDTFTQSPGIAAADGVTDPPAPTDGPDAADLRGRWTATIAGTSRGGTHAYDTYRDLDLWVTFYSDRIQVQDGCQTLETGVVVEGGALTLTSPFELVLGGPDADCVRSAPLPQVVENVRHVTQSGSRTYLHLQNFQIAVVLTRSG